MQNDFIGQKNVKARLSDAIRHHAVSHAYLLEGPKGIGKRTLADWFGRAVHCESGEGTPCGTCHACMMHRAGSHPDMKIILEEEKQSTGVQYIRELIEDIYLKPSIAEQKVYVFPEADTLTEEAQNALLKVFEEPPGESIIILCTQNHEKLLATICSRAARVKLERYSEQVMYDWVANTYPEKKEQASFIARFSGGIIGKAKELCEDEAFLSMRKEWFLILGKLSGEKSSVFEAQKYMLSNKEERDRLYDLMIAWMRDSIQVKLGQNALYNEDMRAEIEAFSYPLTGSGLIAALDTMIKTKTELSKQSNAEMWTLDLFLRCWRNLHGTSNRSTVS